MVVSKNPGPCAFWMRKKSANNAASAAPSLITPIVIGMALLVLLWAALPDSDRSRSRPTAPILTHVIVAPGDTLWSLAHRYRHPAEEAWDAVEAIQRANGGQLSGLRPGQRIQIPVNHPVELARLQPRLASALR